MVREIVKSTDPKLRDLSKKVTKIDKKVISLIEDLKETLDAQTEPEGVGLAAPQIGKNLRIFVMNPDHKNQVIINPEIVSQWKSPKDSKKKSAKNKAAHKKIMEGCLSLPNYYTPLERDFGIEITYLDETGKQGRKVFEGIDAQIVQHEIDHLNGILFVDRLLEQKKKLYEYKNGEWDEIEI